MPVIIIDERDESILPAKLVRRSFHDIRKTRDDIREFSIRVYSRRNLIIIRKTDLSNSKYYESPTGIESNESLSFVRLLVEKNEKRD